MTKIGGSYPLAEVRCLELGGHCYVSTNSVVATNPPLYHRYCKHCGHTQHGHTQEPMKWEDVND